ncbi:MAG: serine/threonine protein phosphatase, partial [Lachnospiraceae bacterium]|nr:serine/threonine protein phosphatase [Lachnospiraceae bacterium]
CISIIMSTMFIKQHSFFDVFTALVMSTVMALFVYREDVLAFYRNRTAVKGKTQRFPIFK